MTLQRNVAPSSRRLKSPSQTVTGKGNVEKFNQ